jgi:hypothetical protein
MSNDTNANTAKTVGINRMRPPVRMSVNSTPVRIGYLSVKYENGRRGTPNKNGFVCEQMARKEIKTANEHLENGNRKLAVKHLNLALDSRGIQDMDERAEISRRIEELER